MTSKTIACSVLALVAVACGGASNNYSTTPCVENCGNDATCQASCTDVSNHDPPPANWGTSK